MTTPGEKQPRSGLKNPQAAIRGLGAAALGLEGLALLLAIQPIRLFGGSLNGLGIITIVVLAGVAFALTGMMKRRWAWAAGTVLQALVIASGLFHWSLAVIGLFFASAWGYA